MRTLGSQTATIKRGGKGCSSQFTSIGKIPLLKGNPPEFFKKTKIPSRA
jgi:hypothetical protein